MIIYYKKRSCILHVHIDIDYIRICKQMQTQSKLDLVDEKYQQTLIYGIICMITGEMYVGATHRTLDERIAEHRRQRVGFGWEILERGNYEAYEIQRWPCNTLREILTVSRRMRETASLKRRINTLNWRPHQGLFEDFN